jgi:hypothetical protein
MTRTRTPLELAAGKLIVAIQKEWGAELGEPGSAAPEEVMHASHDLLQAAKAGALVNLPGSASVSEFLGVQWLQAHPSVRPYVQALETAASGEPRA